MGVYKGNAPRHYSITENVSNVAKTYQYKNGYFGEEGTSNRIRIIFSDDPASAGKDFYDKIAYGGIEEDMPNGKGQTTKMADGTVISFRPTTKSDDNPAVGINIEYSDNHGNLKKQKIHFEKGGKK